VVVVVVVVAVVILVVVALVVVIVVVVVVVVRLLNFGRPSSYTVQLILHYVNPYPANVEKMVSS